MSENTKTISPTPHELVCRLKLIGDTSKPSLSNLRWHLTAILSELPDEVVEFVFEHMLWMTAEEVMEDFEDNMTDFTWQGDRFWFVVVSDEMISNHAEFDLPYLIAKAFYQEKVPEFNDNFVTSGIENMIHEWKIFDPNPFPMLGGENK